MRNYVECFFVWAQRGSPPVPFDIYFVDTEKEAEAVKQAWLDTGFPDMAVYGATKCWVEIKNKADFLAFLNLGRAGLGDPLNPSWPPDLIKFDQSPRDTGINSAVEKKGAIQKGISLKGAGVVVSTKMELSLLYINLLNSKRYSLANFVLDVLRQFDGGFITEKEALDRIAPIEAQFL